MKMKKQLLALLLAAVMVLSLTGCKETLKKVVQKVTGHSEEVQEEDTTRWAESTTDPLIIQGIADASAKYATATADGCLYAVFNGIWSRNTGYFTVPGGSLNIMACGTAEGTQKFKVALWKKVDGGANPDSVSGWSTGSALAAQVKDLRQQAAGGWALYRYGSLFGPEAPALAEAECAALRALNG